MIRDCKRCGRGDDGTLVELVAGCGCVDLYCADCRDDALRKYHPQLQTHAVASGAWLPIAEWLQALGRLHERNGGRYSGVFPCPSRWDDNAVQLSRRSL